MLGFDRFREELGEKVESVNNPDPFAIRVSPTSPEESKVTWTALPASPKEFKDFLAGLLSGPDRNILIHGSGHENNPDNICRDCILPLLNQEDLLGILRSLPKPADAVEAGWISQAKELLNI